MSVLRKLAFIGLTMAASLAHALTIAPYSAEALAKAQRAGEPVAVQFHATWCPTCKAQTQVFDSFRNDPELKMTLLVADYDKEQALEKALKVRQQSTLIVYRGKEERARVVGVTQAADLKAALKAAL